MSRKCGHPLFDPMCPECLRVWEITVREWLASGAPEVNLQPTWRPNIVHIEGIQFFGEPQFVDLTFKNKPRIEVDRAELGNLVKCSTFWGVAEAPSPEDQEHDRLSVDWLIASTRGPC